MLELKNIHKTFNQGTINEKKALQGVDLTIQDGDFITVIGGNGAGKSTLMNIISGTFMPEEGQIIIDGEDITSMPEHKRAQFLGRVFQDPMMGTAPGMEIEENLALAYRRGKRRGLGFGIRRSEREMYHKALQSLNLGLEDRMTSKVELLSGGQRQAITLLMATLVKPKLLMLDEHTAALDPKTAKNVLELTDKIVTENNLTALMITHNMRDAIKYGNRLLMFNNGRIIYDVSGEEKKNLTVESLLQKFEDVDFSDADVLGTKDDAEDEPADDQNLQQ